MNTVTARPITFDQFLSDHYGGEEVDLEDYRRRYDDYLHAPLELAEETRHLSSAGVELDDTTGWDYTTQRRWVSPWK